MTSTPTASRRPVSALLTTVVAVGMAASLTGALAPSPAAAASPGPVSGEGVPSASAPLPDTRATAKRSYYATLTVPRARIKNLPIARNIGTPDDGPGTVIQNRGILSAPHDTWGGVAPGQIGNFFLAGHRSSHGAPLWFVPGLRKGDKMTVTRNGVKYVYIMAYKLVADFRSKASKRAQLAPEPGHLGVAATRPAMVLSTCATPEDAAAGIGWHDRFGNPAHRINMVGFLAGTLASVTAPTASDITTSGATVSASVTPGTGPTTVTFSYSTSPKFTVSTTTTVPASPVTGPTPQTVSAQLSGLTPGTTYYVRATARVAAGITVGSATSFSTVLI